MPEVGSILVEFVEAACVPLDSSHVSGTLEQAEAIRARYPDLAGTSLVAASILGEIDEVRRWIGIDPAGVAAPTGPRGWDPLTYLCFSRYLRLDPGRSAGFVQAATVLLDGGARADTGFFSRTHQPEPAFESALYGAAGVARNAGLTRLLLERGADPNDEEVPYHAPEGYDNEVLEVLVGCGRLNADSLTTMLVRKADWHDRRGIAYLLEHGADPNRQTRWGYTALQQAIRRDNHLRIVESMVAAGADPRLGSGMGEGPTAIAMAARRGRGDVLRWLKERGVATELEGMESLIAACAMDDDGRVLSMAREFPERARELRGIGGTLLAEFAGNGNTPGVRQLLDLGIDVNALYSRGDGYFGIAPDSTALHVAAWRGRHETVGYLLSRGAMVHLTDGWGRTALGLAVKACVDSHWQELRSPESVRVLLEAGASAAGIALPTGYRDVDELLVRTAE